MIPVQLKFDPEFEHSLAQAVQNKAQIYIALSGGVDSVVLLDLIYQLFQKNQYNIASLRVIYVNHQLQPEANNAWQIFCQNIANQYQLHFIAEKIELSPKAGESLENFARIHRYRLFFKHVRPNTQDILLLGHHLDDQAETVLFRLVKGAGPKGLSGMKKLYHYHNRVIHRPLLSISKQSILDYAKKNQLAYIQDPSNHNLNYDRNFLRQAIMPALSSRFGSANKAIVRGARHYYQQQQALDYFIDQALKKIQTSHACHDNCLDFKLLSTYPEQVQLNLIRNWLEFSECKSPSEKKLIQILHQFRTARPDRIPEISWGENNQYIVRKYQSKIFLEKKLNSIHLNKIKDYSAWLSKNLIQEKKRVPGQKVYFLYKTHSSDLKKILQDLSVPPWERDKILLYFYQEKYLVAVAGYWEESLFFSKYSGLI